MRQIKLWFHQVSLAFISGGTLPWCEWRSYGRPHPTSGVWTASQPWTPSFGITTTPSHGQRRRSSAGLSVTLDNSLIFIAFFIQLFWLLLVWCIYTVNSFTEVAFHCLLVIRHLNGTNMAVYIASTVSSIIILYRCLCFHFSWSLLQCVCAVTVSAPAPPETGEFFQLFVSKAKLHMQIWSTCIFKMAHFLAVFFFSQFLSIIFMQLVSSDYGTPSLSFDRCLWFLGSLWLINSTSTATKHLLSVIRVRLNGPDKHGWVPCHFDGHQFDLLKFPRLTGGYFGTHSASFSVISSVLCSLSR